MDHGDRIHFVANSEARIIPEPNAKGIFSPAEFDTLMAFLLSSFAVRRSEGLKRQPWLRENGEPVAFNYNDAFNLYEGEYLLTFDGEKTVSLYNFVTDKMLIKDLKEEKPEIVQRMEPKAKAIIQQYNNRLIENRLTVD